MVNDFELFYASSWLCSRAVKLKIVKEEWEYCFYFSLLEVLELVKYV